MKKILTKAVAALVSAVTLSSMAGAMTIPTSAVDMSYGVGKNSSMQYTIYTTKVSDTKVKLTLKILNNPGIQNMVFVIMNDPAVKSSNDDDYFDFPKRGMVKFHYYAEEKNYTSMTYIPQSSSSHEQFEFSVVYDVDKNYKGNYNFRVGFTQYNSPSEPNAKFSHDCDGNLSSSDADAIVEISPSTYVKLGDIDNNNIVDSTDLFYMEKILSDSVEGQLSTTYLDQQLKNRNSTWSKNYPFLKCAAVADIDHNTMIQDTDSDSLAKYVAEAGAGATISNKEINTLLPVTVVYDN